MKPKIEHYSFNFDLQKPDGKWVRNKTDRVFVEISKQDKPKKNFDLAEEELRKKYNGADLVVNESKCFS